MIKTSTSDLVQPLNIYEKYFELKSQAFLLWKMLHSAQCSCINASNPCKSLIFDLAWTIRHTGPLVYVPNVRSEPQKWPIFLHNFFWDENRVIV